MSARSLLLDAEASGTRIGASRPWLSKVAAGTAAFAGVMVVVSTCRSSLVGVTAPQTHSKPSSFAAVQKYTQAQYLGFNIITAPGTQADGCFDTGSGGFASCYLGSPEVENDLYKRFTIMRTAIVQAYDSPHWDRNPSTLKVFMAPEFYWRGARGAYRLSNQGLKEISKSMLNALNDFLGDERFANWVFVLGTVIAADKADPEYVGSLENPSYHDISYFNFAPIYVGGTTRKLLQFKEYISGIDFLQGRELTGSAAPVEPAPGSGSKHCKQDPTSNGCIYAQPKAEVLAEFGFGDFEVVDSVFELDGLRIGVEVCLDHKRGTLAKVLGEDSSVDLQLIVSAGMLITAGPVCTGAGGPVFLSDGFARTEMTLNQFGRGRDSVNLPNGRATFNVGMIYGADPLVALQQWAGDSVMELTGNSFGIRRAGEATLPSGGQWSGASGISFAQVSALGNNWFSLIDGFYNTAAYLEVAKMQAAVQNAVAKMEGGEESAASAEAFPTVDIYGPVPLPPRP